MKNSGINWTHHTANFWWGCMKVSPGCTNCYALTLSKRYGKSIWGPPQTTDRELKSGIWKEILKWDKEAGSDGVRRRVFVSSMSDFLEDHPQVVEWRERAKAIMADLKNLDVLLLTKRLENAPRFLADWMKDFPPHVWMGTSVEDQKAANERIPYLLKIPAQIKFLSVEPMLSSVDLTRIPIPPIPAVMNSLHRASIFAPSVQWVIVGGESQVNCRPFEVEWARDLLRQCRDSGTKFWMKQLGGHPYSRHELADLPEDLRVRELPVKE